MPRAPWDRTPCAPGTSRGCAPRRAARGGLVRDVIQPAKGQLRPGQKRLDLGIRCSRAEVGVVHPVLAARWRRALGIDPQRRAEAVRRRRRPVGPRRGRTAPRRGCVHHAVQRDAPGQADHRSPVVACNQRARSRTVFSRTTCSEWAISKWCCPAVRHGCGRVRTAARDRAARSCRTPSPVDDAAERSRRGPVLRTRPGP